MPHMGDGRARFRPQNNDAAHGQREVSRERVSPLAPRPRNPEFPQKNVTFLEPNIDSERDPFGERNYKPSLSHHGSYDPYHFQQPLETQQRVLSERVRYVAPVSRPPSARRTTLISDESYDSDWYDDEDENDRVRRIRRVPPPSDPGVVPSIERPAILVNPSDPKDVTVHMSLDTTPDIEGFLEENARLRRLGHFTKAIAQFKTLLLPYLDNKYVLVQYGQCLYEAQQHGTLSELAKKYPLVEVEDGHDIQLNWNVLLRKAERLDEELDFQSIIDSNQLTAVAFDRMNGPNLDSTQIQILTLALDISTVQSIKEDYIWHYACRSLRAQQRIWEFRDLFLELEVRLGLKEARDLVANYGTEEHEESPVDTIITDWSELDEDESTYFAALDLFSSLAFSCMKDKGNLKDVEKCLDVAERFATYLLELDVQNLKTRPCLMWMMARVYIEEYKLDNHMGSTIIFKGTIRGDYRVNRNTFPNDWMPLYAPYEDEIPEWRPKAIGIPEESKQITKIVLKAAEEIGDVALQVSCLQQLLDQGSDNPSREVKRISELLAASGNMARHLGFLLFRYMLIKTEEDKAALRRDILEHGALGEGFTEFCRCMILRALSSKTWEKKHYHSLAEYDYPVHYNDRNDDGEGDGVRKPLGKDEASIIERPVKDSSKGRGTKDAKPQNEEVEEEKRRHDQVVIGRALLEKDAEITKLKEELEELKRTRPPAAQLEWADFQPTTAGKKNKKKKKTIDEAGGATDNADKRLEETRRLRERFGTKEPSGWDKPVTEGEARKSATATTEGPTVEEIP